MQRVPQAAADAGIRSRRGPRTTVPVLFVGLLRVGWFVKAVPWWDKSRNYFLCRLCGKILRMNRVEKRSHCGEIPKAITDVEARSRIEGKKKGRRFSAVVTSRGATDLQNAEFFAKYKRMVRKPKGQPS